MATRPLKSLKGRHFTGSRRNGLEYRPRQNQVDATSRSKGENEEESKAFSVILRAD